MSIAARFWVQLLVLMMTAAPSLQAASPAKDESTAVAHPRMAVLRDVMAPMRDGVRLAADVYLPSDDGVSPIPGRFPVLLMRTPYNKKIWSNAGAHMVTASSGGITAQRAIDRGYAVVFQDVRGTYASEGKFEPMRNEGSDGVDTVAWVKSQPWSDGRVATFGPSYMGGVQMLLAAEDPAGLVTAFPQVAATDQFRHWVYRDGVYTLGTAAWTWFVTTGQAPRLGQPEQSGIKADIAALGLTEPSSITAPLSKMYTSLPLSEMPVVRNFPWWGLWQKNRDNPAFFERNEMHSRFKNISVPMLHVGGWYDLFLRNSYTHYTSISKEGKTAFARQNQRLIIGPWSHFTCEGCDANASVDAAAMQLAWMDRWVKGKPHPFFDHPVTLYIMGENRWRAERGWPLEGTVRTRYFLQSGPHANMANGGGSLSLSPAKEIRTDRYDYDPKNPAPTLGGPGLMGSRMLQNPAAGRPDILAYTTPPLDRDTEVTGEVKATLFAASSATDTDWWVKLIDVAPDGKAYILTQGVARARYRKSRTNPEPLVPGKVEQYQIDMWATSNVFKKGHRIRVEITSSNFPYAERNPNAFVDLGTATESDFKVASQTIYNGGVHASFVDLPIIPESRARNWIDTPFPAAPVAAASH